MNNEQVEQFIYLLLNDRLNEFSDQQITNQDIDKILLEIKNIQNNQFNLEKTINKIIIDTSKCLPYISLKFCDTYYTNFPLIYQALTNIFKYIKNLKSINDKSIFFARLLTCIINIIYDHKILYNDKEFILLMKNHIKSLISIKQWNKIFIYLIYEAKKTNQMNFTLQTLFYIYKVYIDNQYSLYKKQKIINIFTKYIIIFFKNNGISHLYEVYNDKKYFLNFTYLDLIRLHWNIINNKYKNIIKENSFQWINYWEQNNYYIDNDQKNSYLQFIEHY